MQTKHILKKVTAYDPNYISTSYLYNQANDTYTSSIVEAEQFDNVVDGEAYITNNFPNHTVYLTVFELVKIYVS